MDTSTWIVIAVVVVVVALIVVGILLALRARQRRRLREQFGPEYDRTIEGADKRRQAESELRDRIDLRNRVQVQPLAPAARDRYAAQWQDAQTRFVDEPTIVVAEADTLVANVMRERGYP